MRVGLSAFIAAGGGASSAGAWSNRLSSTFVIFFTPRPPSLAPAFFGAANRGLAAGGFRTAAHGRIAFVNAAPNARTITMQASQGDVLQAPLLCMSTMHACV